ncbi:MULTISPECIES: GNAT family N-acetyltransferase [unclassified Devosia]|uniref:GNAT family N-acetyltransferase n=1 Tax=unclassified Devosia TaxID=196773 RepID=UPI001553CA68|nr:MULTISPECIES: GNAT family N-acetyltransferase [unclassified Devosia]
MQIRPAFEGDRSAVLAIVAPVLRAGETYAMPRDLDDEQVLAYWFSPAHQVFVAEDDNGVLGTYYLKPNQLGPGAHVANCGYMTAAAAQGRGVARAMGTHSIEQAGACGFRAIQFNHVVSTNQRAVALWQSLGFAIVGTLPKAFDHPVHGFVDSYVMFRTL